MYRTSAAQFLHKFQVHSHSFGDLNVTPNVALPYTQAFAASLQTVMVFFRICAWNRIFFSTASQ